MTHELYFVNPGEIDVRCITTMGVNVKSEGAIGYFGTGLKYAIAVLLREGQSIEIWSGRDRYSFWADEETIKGKCFQIVKMSSSYDPTVSLGFTTDLGRNWTLEDAYREIYCNCKDEHGDPEAADQNAIGTKAANLQNDHTIIRLTGQKIWEQHQQRRRLILDPNRLPIWSSDSLQIYHGSSSRLYYRGIAAQDGEKRYKFTYNFICDMQLSEDRELISYYASSKLAAELLQCDDEVIVETVFEDKESLEATIPYLTWHSSPGPTFLTVAERLRRRDPIDCPQSVSSLWQQYATWPENARQSVQLTNSQSAALAAAKLWLARCGFNIVQHDVTVCADLGHNILGMVDSGQIFIAIAAFASLDLLKGTLIEELLHLERKILDGRLMQDAMLREILRLGTELIEQLPSEAPEDFPQPQLSFADLLPDWTN